MLENVTVIIPAHNRPERLRRLLEYYAGTGIQILIPDSSDNKYTGEIDPSTTVYIHRPRMHFLLKIKEVLPLIKTPYVLYCADDDFTVPEAIAQMARFLDEHDDYSVAQGHYLTFTPDGDKIQYLPRYIRNFDSRIDGATAVERLNSQCGIYASLLYAVVRADSFRRIYSHCFDADNNLRFRNLFLAEEFFQHAMLIEGKYATLPCFYSARERIKGSATSTTVPSSVIKTRPEHAAEFQGYITALSTLLTDRTGMDAAQAEAEIRRVVAAAPDRRSVLFKRRVNAWLSKSVLLRPLELLSEWRYGQKGLKAVRGMASYPCTTATPQRQRIEQLVLKK